MSDRHVDDDFIPVVAAVIADAQRLLLCQRQDGPHLPLLWEFPGGKVDPGESPTDALARELQEELGVQSCIGPRIHEVRHTYPEKKVWIRFYAAAISGTPKPYIHREVRWVDVEDLGSYEVPPPNAEVLRQILVAGINSIPSVRAPSTPAAGKAETAPA
jgi:8-oxo-dGTP diphosphatase